MMIWASNRVERTQALDRPKLSRVLIDTQRHKVRELLNGCYVKQVQFKQCKSVSLPNKALHLLILAPELMVLTGSDLCVVDANLLLETYAPTFESHNEKASERSIF